MINIKLKDGSVLQAEAGSRLIDIARSISEGLARSALSASVDGQVRDLTYAVYRDSEISFLAFEDEGGRLAYRHTASHVLAQAIKRLYPNTKLAIGPAIADGFYYDVDSDTVFYSRPPRKA
jgi:threonyl-tRNA synthetase